MESNTYLENLGWDKNWKILTKEESQSYLAIPNYMNNMFEIKDMTGKKLFGEKSYVCNINWLEKHNSQPVVEEVIPPPPPAPSEPEVLPPPVKEELPQKLQEIVDASPNIKVVTIAPPSEIAYPNFVRTRVASLITKGWTPHDKLSDMLVSPDKEKTIGYEDVEAWSDSEFMETLRGFKVAPEPLNEHGRTESEQVDFDAQDLPVKSEPKKVDIKVGHQRIEFLVKNGSEAHEIDDTPAVLTPDGKIFTVGELAKMENEAWMQITTEYSAFNVKKMKDANKAKASELSDEQLKANLEKQQQDNILARENAKKEAAKAIADDNEGLSAVEQDERDAAVDDEPLYDQEEADEYEDYHGKVIDNKTISIEMPDDVAKQHEAEAKAYDRLVDIANGDDLTEEESVKLFPCERDEIARDVMLKLLSRAGKRPTAENVAEYSYAVADAMIELKNKK